MYVMAAIIKLLRCTVFILFCGSLVFEVLVNDEIIKRILEDYSLAEKNSNKYEVSQKERII